MKRTPLVNSFTRVWVIDGGARVDRDPEFLYYMKLDTVEKNFGSVNPIYEPSKIQYNEFDETASYRDEEERPTSSLIGRYPQSVRSRILQLAQKKCQVDAQLHIGACTSPGVFNDFMKVLIFEDVAFETYSTDSLGSIEPGERNPVNETVEVSAKKMYEYVPIEFAARSPADVTNELVAAALCDIPACGDCGTISDGCQKILSVSKAAGGSAGTPADIVFSIDGGANFFAEDIDTLGVAVDPTDVGCVGDYAVVISSEDGDQMHIVDKDDLDGVIDPEFTQVTTGFVANAGPTCMDSIANTAYFGALNGYIYKTSDPASGVTVVDAGEATTSTLNDIDMFTDDFQVAVGNDGVVVTIENDIAGAIANQPVGIGTNLNVVLVISETEWLVGADDGNMYYTVNKGVAWTAKALVPVATSVTDIKASTKSVIYVAATVSGKGEIFVSIDGGNSFIRAPRSSSNAMPVNDQINAIVPYPFDVDFVAGFGLADDATDGFIVIGSD